MQISASRLMATMQSVLQKAGCEENEARTVTEHLVAANLKGHDSHGVGMLPHYVEFIEKGIMHPNTPARLVRDSGAVLQFTGDRTGKNDGRVFNDAVVYLPFGTHWHLWGNGGRRRTCVDTLRQR